MQLRHLEYFVAVAKTGSVSAAADAVHVTQPVLSRQLRRLEAELGVALFDRAPGRVALNGRGRALLARARAVLAAAEELEAAARFHARGGMETVEIAAPTVTLTDIVSPFVSTMEPADPVAGVRPGDGQTTAEMLDAGADLAIGTTRPQPPYRSLALTALQVWAYVPESDPWAGRDVVTLDELVTRPVIRVPPAYAARASLDSAMALRGLSGAAWVEAANGTIAQALAAAGRGVAVVSDDPRFGLVPIPVDAGGIALTVGYHVAWDPRGPAAATVEAIAGRLATWVADRYARHQA